MSDDERIRRRLRERQVAPVPLRIAASLVYFQLHRDVSAQNEEALDRALNDAALALAQIADIYYENHAHHILRIPDEELRSGLFGGGAKMFRSSGGQEYRALSMRRIDLMQAMEVLSAAGQAFAAAQRGGQPAPSDEPQPEQD